jgi:hypothetical protein
MKIINPIILLVLIPLDPTDTLIGLDQAIAQYAVLKGLLPCKLVF